MKIKKNDKVLVITGKYKGKIGKVIKALPKKMSLIVENVNIIKKHLKPRRAGQKGEIIEKPAPINISNVKLICPRCNKATRVGYKVIENKAKKIKYRVCKVCKSTIS